MGVCVRVKRGGGREGERERERREEREPLIFPQSFGIGGGSAEVPKHQTA